MYSLKLVMPITMLRTFRASCCFSWLFLQNVYQVSPLASKMPFLKKWERRVIFFYETSSVKYFFLWETCQRFPDMNKI